jgi:hypothetical protein
MKNRVPVVAVLVLMMLFLPMLYVVSIGPAVWLAQRGYLNQEATARWYYPIQWVHRKCPPLRPALEWYVMLFEP